MSNKLTQEELEAIGAVSEGADVYAYGLAKALRSVQNKVPGLIVICEPQAYEGDGTNQMPYFGCIATAAGKRAAAEAAQEAP